MKKKLSKKKLKKMIASDFTDLSTEEIKVLIQKEVNKKPDEIDTDYIDLCFELLSMKDNKKNARKAKPVKFAKIVSIAAVLIIVFVSTLSVSAQFKLNIPQEIAQLVNGNAEFDENLENADTTADGYALLDTELARELADYGFSPVTFPEKMVKEGCVITGVQKTLTSDFINEVVVNFEYNSQKGYLTIMQRANDDEWDDNAAVMNVKSGHMLNINGLDILIFKVRYGYCIQYKDNSLHYSLNFDCDSETAIEFVKSIK